MSDDEKFLYAKQQAETKYKFSPGRSHLGRVIACEIGTGTKWENDKLQTKSKCLCFYVERKMAMDDIHPDNRIETPYEGVPTDVIATGRLVPFAPLGGPGSMLGLDQRVVRSNVDSSRTGMLGGIVRIQGEFFALGSNHAMAANGRATGLQIQLRPRDRFINRPDDSVIARISDYVPLDPFGLNQVDCALAHIEDRSFVEDQYRARVTAKFPGQIVSSKKGVDPASVKRVTLVNETAQDADGRATGEIVKVGAACRFDFSFGSFDFENLVLIQGHDNKPFAQPGDSGTLVASSDGSVTAMVMGGSRRKLPAKKGEQPLYTYYTFACPFNQSLAQLARRLAMAKTAATIPDIELMIS